MGKPEELRDFDKGVYDFFRELYPEPRMLERAIAFYKGSVHGRPNLGEVTVYDELFTTEMTPPNLEAILVHAGNRLLPHLRADEKSEREGLLFPYLYNSGRGCPVGRVVLRFLLIEDGHVKLPLGFQTQELQPDGSDMLSGVEFEKDEHTEDIVTTAVDKKIVNLKTFSGNSPHDLEPRIDLGNRGQIAWESSAPVIKPFTQEGDIFRTMLGQLDRAVRDLAIERDLPII